MQNNQKYISIEHLAGEKASIFLGNEGSKFPIDLCKWVYYLKWCTICAIFSTISKAGLTQKPIVKFLAVKNVRFVIQMLNSNIIYKFWNAQLLCEFQSVCIPEQNAKRNTKGKQTET